VRCRHCPARLRLVLGDMGLNAEQSPTDLPLAASFELLGPSLHVFHRAVGCLTKLARDAAVILRAEELVLHGADDAHSVAMQFAFRRKFFHSTPASVAAAAGMRQGGEASIVVLARALLSALRGASQRTAESLMVGLSDPRAGEQRLILQFTAKFGAMVRHRVPLLDTTAFLPGEPASGPHSAAVSPGLLARVLDHCSPPAARKGGPGASCEEVTMAAVPREGLRVQSSDLLSSGGVVGGTAQANRTEVMIQRSDLEACNIESGGEVTFSGRALRDFAQATEKYMRDLEVLGLIDGSPLLELRFGAESGTVVCRLASVTDGVVRGVQDFSAVLLIATREQPGESQGLQGEMQAATQQPPGAAQGAVAASQAATPAGRRPQPRQGPGSKRRAVVPGSVVGAFDAFPEHASQLTRTQAQTPTQPTSPTLPMPGVGLKAFPATQLTQGLLPTFTPAARTNPPAAGPGMRQQPAQAAAHQMPAQPLQGIAPMQVERPQAMHGAAPGADSMSLLASPPATGAPAGAPQRHLQSMMSGVSAQPHSNQFTRSAAQCGVPAFQAGGPPSALAMPQLVGAAPTPMSSVPPTMLAPVPIQQDPALQQRAGGAWWQGGQAPPPQLQAARPDTGSAVLASQLSRSALQVPDSDDELVGADPDEVAFARGDPGDDSVDWFDVERLW